MNIVHVMRLYLCNYKNYNDFVDVEGHLMSTEVRNLDVTKLKYYNIYIYIRFPSVQDSYYFMSSSKVIEGQGKPRK